MLGSFLRGLLLTTLGLQVIACGGSSDSQDNKKYDKPYVQFYNGSADSGSIYVNADQGSNLGSAVYGDATSLFTLDKSDVQLGFSQQGDDGNSQVIEELAADIDTGQKLLVVASGTKNALKFSAYPITRKELDKRFRLFAASVLTSGQNYDLYLADSGESFAEAHLLSTVTTDGLEELTSWQTDDSDSFAQGEYQVFLTLPGETSAIFASRDIAFNYATEYTMVIRTSSGAIKNNLEIDLVINSSSVSNYTDREQAAQYRIYNSLDAQNVLVDINGGQNNQQHVTVNGNGLSDFNSIAYGDYQLSGEVEGNEGLLFSNRLLSLSQGRSNAIVIYQDAEQLLQSLTFEESTLPQSVEHELQVVNLTPDYESLDVFFVRQSETIKSAKYRLQNLNFQHSAKLTVPSGQYEIVIVYNDNSSQLLLERSDMFDIDQDVNYIVSVEKSSSSPSGYKVSLLY
ncbi:DUF4397 domain-containing protein [Paraglaciecola polaris]|uniref:DUF4397 domain-containing protein n=1 Tax=Paraglaciecola polaris TaxID=222814 RepID=UPI0030ED4E8A|tara:strand:- start:545 stop:1912 length:1368 start_codon:yes stop_codon:yes gene_type:complete